MRAFARWLSADYIEPDSWEKLLKELDDGLIVLYDASGNKMATIKMAAAKSLANRIRDLLEAEK